MGVFGDDDAAIRRADSAVVDGLLRLLDACLRADDLRLSQGDLGLETVGGGAGIIELLLGLHAGVLELLCATELDARVFELHFEIGDSSFGRGVVRFGGVQRFAGIGIV